MVVAVGQPWQQRALRKQAADDVVRYQRLHASQEIAARELNQRLVVYVLHLDHHVADQRLRVGLAERDEREHCPQGLGVRDVRQTVVSEDDYGTRCGGRHLVTGGGGVGGSRSTRESMGGRESDEVI